MSYDLFKRQVYAGLVEILNDQNLYRKSSVHSDYDKLTEEGEKAIVEYFVLMAPHILQKEHQEIDKRAKALVLGELKK